MRRHKITEIALIFSIFLAAWQVSSAEGYPVLPGDSSVKTGKLANGLTYYITANTSAKGVADMALVQKTGGAQAGIFARECLDSLPLFRNRKPADFLIDNGIRQPKSGYISVSGDAVTYRFRNLPLTGSSAVTDSLVLMLFDLANMGIKSGQPGYLPENQAIIISGDIDASSIIQKLQILSLMIPKEEAPAQTQVEAAAVKDTAFMSGTALQNGITSLKITFRTGKLPEKYMKTVLPLMSKHMWNLSAKILRNRLEREFEAAGIPVGKISFSRLAEEKYSGYDEYFISLTVNDSDKEAAEKILLAQLNDMAGGGLTEEELLSAKLKTMVDMRRLDKSTSLSNEIMVDKCISAFIYGASIVSSKDEAAYLLSSDVPDKVWTNLLTDFMKGLVTSLPERESDYALTCKPYTTDARDTVLFPVKVGKTKISTSRTVKITDGQVWTFSNGMNVYYKDMAVAGGDMFYSLTLRSGYGQFSDLKSGEGAFFSDMFFTGRICGMDGRSFRSILEDNGISMAVKVGLSDTRIYGRIAGGKLEFFLKAMQAVCSGYEADTTAAKYHLACEKVRLTERQGTFESRMASVDSILCSGYNYSTIKNLSGIHDDLPTRTADFFRDLLTKADNGGLILVGKMEELKLKKLLQTYMGGFPTTGIPSLNPVIRFQPTSGWSTHSTTGKDKSIDVVMSTQLPLSGENYMAARIASYFVYDALADQLSGYGAYWYTVPDFSFTPTERFSLSVSVEKADTSGLPATLTEASFLQVLYAIRTAISSLNGMDIPADKLSMYKNRLKAEYDSESKKPEWWRAVISDRISFGKTFNRYYSDSINSVSAESVKKVISALSEGSRVEYITNPEE